MNSVSTAARAPFPHSASTGHYTIEQIEGDACARCGRRFMPWQRSTPGAPFNGFALYTHVTCPGGAEAVAR